MTKIHRNVFGIETISTLALVLLSAVALISVQTSVPAGQRLNSDAAAVSTVEAGSISPYAMHLAVNVSALPVRDGYAAF